MVSVAATVFCLIVWLFSRVSATNIDNLKQLSLWSVKAIWFSCQIRYILHAKRCVNRISGTFYALGKPHSTLSSRKTIYPFNFLLGYGRSGANTSTTAYHKRLNDNRRRRRRCRRRWLDLHRLRQREFCPAQCLQSVQQEPRCRGISCCCRGRRRQEEETRPGDWEGGGGEESRLVQRWRLAVQQVRQCELGTAATVQCVQCAQVWGGGGEDGLRGWVVGIFAADNRKCLHCALKLTMKKNIAG